MVNILIGFVPLAVLLSLYAFYPVQFVGVLVGVIGLGVCWMLGDMLKDIFS